MKSIFKKIVFTSSILVALIIASCSSSDDSPSNQNQTGGDYFLTVKIDGVDFSANSENSNVSALADITPIYTIIGIDDNGGRITLMLESPITVGTFSTSPNNSELGSGAVLFYTSPSNEVFSVADGTGQIGTVTITSNNGNSVKGTFSFTGESQQSDDIKVFTEGRFKAKKVQ